jgi:biopolymer transport protein ExbD
MADSGLSFGGMSAGSLLARKPHQENPDFDITAMIDLVFMMNIYFLVTFITVALSEIELPAADYCEALDSESALTVTVTQRPDGDSVNVFVGDSEGGEPLPRGEEEIKMLLAAVEQAMADGKTAVLLKAERGVIVGELFRISSAIATKGLELRMAVSERDDVQ